MNVATLALLMAMIPAVLMAPRRWVALPFLVVAIYLPTTDALVVGPFNFYPLRLVVAAGIVRAMARPEGIGGGVNDVDRCMVIWAVVAIATSLFHEPPIATLVNRLGLVFTGCGTYFLLRTYCRNLDETVRLCLVAIVLLVPVGLEMLFEARTGRNLFAAFGGVAQESEVRSGQIRAQGPFAHAILAGTIGATCLPLAVALWRTHRFSSIAGFLTCGAIVVASRSSGPVMSALVAIAALCLWPGRNWTRVGISLAVAAYVVLELVMNAPAYYLLTRIDFTGSSTSWHRAALIDTAFAHIGEWWLVGTDHTRHWMAYGGLWSSEQVDFTNYYLRMGVDGGLPLLLAFVVVLAKGFGEAGHARRRLEENGAIDRYVPWAYGASLIAHGSAFVSVAYFDQSVAFFYITLAAAASCGVDAPASRTNPAPSTPLPVLRYSTRQ